MVAASATSLRRGVEILLALTGDDAVTSGGLGVTRVGELVEREKSQVSRSLRVLAEYGLVDRDPETLDYRIGWRFFALAGRAGDQRLLTAAPPILRALVEQFGERAHLSVLQGANVLTVLSESPSRAVEAAGWVGRSVPVYCTSSGRALLFAYDAADIPAVLRQIRFDGQGPNAPTSIEELFRRVDAARSRGFALVDEEFEAGLVAAAAPVRDFRGRVIAAVNVSAPKFRFGERLPAGGEAVKTAADELSRRLGWVDGDASGSEAPR